MKELSIEEKAKRYDEALKYAMIYYKDGNEDMKMMMKTCFPVLVEESEDEMIRKKVIATIHLYYGEPLEDEAKEMIAWLEKQGKNNIGISEATKKELEDNLNNALEKETPESWNEFLEKQGEQKSAWSEEDERRLKSCLNILQPKTFVGNTETINTKWLKSLKDRVQPQPKQEWSENDERIRKISIGLLEVLGYQGYATRESVDWLKSLRPQKQWKPSDEQMNNK